MKWEDVLEKAKGEDGSITVDAVKKVIDDNKVKFVDLSEDGYVSKNKYTSELEAKTKEISTLNETLKTRDTDLEGLKNQLAEAGTDADKLTALQNEFNGLKGKYDEATKSYKAQLEKQAYEFAVKEFAGTKKFTSNAARRDFINSMIAENLKFKDNKIIGAEDFVGMYTESNADAFVVETPPEPPKPAEPKPQFASATPGASANPSDKMTLSEMMKMKNDNPGMAINF